MLVGTSWSGPQKQSCRATPYCYTWGDTKQQQVGQEDTYWRLQVLLAAVHLATTPEEIVGYGRRKDDVRVLPSKPQRDGRNKEKHEGQAIESARPKSSQKLQRRLEEGVSFVLWFPTRIGHLGLVFSVFCVLHLFLRLL